MRFMMRVAGLVGLAAAAMPIGTANAKTVPEHYTIKVEILDDAGGVQRTETYKCHRAQTCYNGLKVKIDGKPVEAILAGRVFGTELMSVTVTEPKTHSIDQSVVNKPYAPGERWDAELFQERIVPTGTKTGAIPDFQHIKDVKVKLRYAVE